MDVSTINCGLTLINWGVISFKLIVPSETIVLVNMNTFPFLSRACILPPSVHSSYPPFCSGQHHYSWSWCARWCPRRPLCGGLGQFPQGQLCKTCTETPGHNIYFGFNSLQYEMVLLSSVWFQCALINTRLNLVQAYEEKEIHRLVYFGGVAPSLRKEVWPFLLGHYQFTMTEKCRLEVFLCSVRECVVLRL